MISVVVVYHQEKELIKGLIENIRPFVDEIVIVNIGREADLAEIKGNDIKIINHSYVSFVEKIRNLAISKASCKWVLVLDPDERVPKKLVGLLKLLAADGEYSAVNIPRKNIFFGKWIAHSNFWPDRHIRFFEKNRILWPQRIHSYPNVNGKVKNLPADPSIAIEHFGYDNFGQFYKKQDRYSTVEAKNRLDLGQRFSVINLIWLPVREFLVRFVKHRGYLDGFAGIFITWVLMIYQVKVQFKMLKGKH